MTEKTREVGQKVKNEFATLPNLGLPGERQQSKPLNSGFYNLRVADQLTYNGALLSQLFHREGHDKTIELMLRKLEKLKGSDKHIASRLQTIVDTERTFLSQIEASRLAAQAGLRGRIHVK